MTVELLTKENCIQCSATKRALDKAGISYTERDVVEDEAALAEALALGYMAAPVVIVNGGAEHWSGFRPERIASLVA